MKNYVLELRKKEKEAKELVTIQLSPDKKIEMDSNPLCNVGYLYIQKVLFMIGLGQINERSTLILTDWVCRRLFDKDFNSIEPCSYTASQKEQALQLLEKEKVHLIQNAALHFDVRINQGKNAWLCTLLTKVLKKMLEGKYTESKIVETLENMDIHRIQKNLYIPHFVRTDVSDDLAEAFGFEFDLQRMDETYLYAALRKARQV